MEPDPVFRKALENFKKDLTVQQRREFAISTLQDVKDEVNKIQIQHGSAKKLRGMSRMSKFLEAMQQLEQVVSVFLNVSEVVAFIWGPVKFFLVVASSRLEILECLLDTFTDISEAMPDLQGYASIFKDQPEVLEVLKRCYGDIIQFYHMAFGVLGRPGAFGIRDWRRIFDSVWKTFRTKFSPVLGSLRRHRELLVQVKLTATYGAIETTRHALQETIEKSNEELKRILNAIQQKKKQILDKLGSQGSHNDMGHRRLPDRRYPTSGDWILEERLFLQWLNPDDSSSDLLYLNGMPGAGKTTLVSRIIEGISKETIAQQRTLLNFYFEHGQSGKTVMMDMLLSFIEQVLQQDDAIVDDLHETVLPARPSDLRSIPWLEDIATRMILAQRQCYIVVDGLDECSLDQRQHILQWLMTILSKSRASRVVVKVLVSGQRDGVIDAMLQDCACVIRLDDQTPHLRDIENFSSSVLSQIKYRFPGLEEEEEMLQKLDPLSITQASKGMFMYAKVVLDNFLSQTSVFELEQELEREYPHGLDEAYDRVAERVLDNTSDSQKQASLQILGLVACAARPLKWREIQCYFCIDAVNGTCDPRRRKVGPKDLCSSFVESEACTLLPNEESEAQIIMVHNTAKRSAMFSELFWALLITVCRSYLLQSGRLDILQQHLQMSLFCFHYLEKLAVNTISQDSKAASIAAWTGFYGFFDYATAHWDHHSLQYVYQAFLRGTALSSEKGSGRSLSKAWIDFAKRFSAKHESLPKASSEHDVSLHDSKSQPDPPDTVDAEGESCNIQEVFKDWTLTRRSTEFNSLAISVRQIMQQTILDTLKDREKAIYLALNGPFQPKCSRRHCRHFNTGFKSEAELSLHVAWHEMAFKCPHAGCHAWLAGFPTSVLLQRHLKRVHPVIEPEERLFPVKPRRRPRTLEEACRLGNMDFVRSFSVNGISDADMPALYKAMNAAAQQGHHAICVHLAQLGANPYTTEHQDYSAPSRNAISVIQMSIRLGDLELFSALREATWEFYKIAFIEEPSALLECILDALESPSAHFLTSLLDWNDRRTKPFALDKILRHACVETQRQIFGHGELSSTKRRVIIESLSVQERLQTLISSELERHRTRGLSPEHCYEKVLVAPDVAGWSLLHRLCGGRHQHTSGILEAVRFLLTRLRPEDMQRHNLEGHPPLFTAMENNFRCEGTALDDQAKIIRSFFEHDLEGAKNTRDVAGYGPLEFAFRHGTLEIFPLVFELCGADYEAVQLYDVFAILTDRGLEKISRATGLDRVDRRIRMAAGLTSEEMHGFMRLLMDLKSELDVVKMLQSLIRHLPGETTDALPVCDFLMLKVLQSVHLAPIRFLLSLKASDRMLKMFRQELNVLPSAKLRGLLFICLEANTNRPDVAKLLLTEHKLELKSAGPEENLPVIEELASRKDMDPEIVSLLQRYGGYRDLSSREAQDKVIVALRHKLYLTEKEEAIYQDEMREYVDSLQQIAENEGYDQFAASLNYIRQCFRWQDVHVVLSTHD